MAARATPGAESEDAAEVVEARPDAAVAAEAEVACADWSSDETAVTAHPDAQAADAAVLHTDSGSDEVVTVHPDVQATEVAVVRTDSSSDEAMPHTQDDCRGGDAVAAYKEGLLLLARKIQAAREQMEEVEDEVEAEEADVIAESAHNQAWAHVLKDEIVIARAELQTLHHWLETGDSPSELQAPCQLQAPCRLEEAPRRTVGDGASAAELFQMRQHMAQLEAMHEAEMEANRVELARTSLQVAQLTSELEFIWRERGQEELPCDGIEPRDKMFSCEACGDEEAAQAMRPGPSAAARSMLELQERVGGLQAALEEEAARCVAAKEEARQELLDAWRRDPSAGWSSLRDQMDTRIAEPGGTMSRGRVQERWKAIREQERTLREQELVSLQQHRLVHLAQERSLLSEKQELLASIGSSRSPSPNPTPTAPTRKKRGSLGKVWEQLNGTEARSSGGHQAKSPRYDPASCQPSLNERSPGDVLASPLGAGNGEPEGEPEHAEVGSQADARLTADEEPALFRESRAAERDRPGRLVEGAMVLCQ